MKRFMLVCYLGFSGLTHAETDPCKSKLSQTEMNQCFTESARADEAQLAGYLGEYKKRLDGDQSILLDNSQIEWVRFRNSACRFQASGAMGGTAYTMVLALCYVEYTRRRIEDLKSLMNCEEGDLTCPAW